jgi:hypothetical protein
LYPQSPKVTNYNKKIQELDKMITSNLIIDDIIIDDHNNLLKFNVFKFIKKNYPTCFATLKTYYILKESKPKFSNLLPEQQSSIITMFNQTKSSFTSLIQDNETKIKELELKVSTGSIARGNEIPQKNIHLYNIELLNALLLLIDIIMENDSITLVSSARGGGYNSKTRKHNNRKS